jgi:hypothetical protein
VRQKICGLDTANCAFDQPAKLLPLFLGDGGVEILNLDEALADKNYLGNFRNARHP